jgi:Fe-S oxidoreductase
MSRSKILLIYIGKEQGSWGTIAYPKPAHYYIMPGILSIASALNKDPWFNELYDVVYRYFNRTMESQEEILQDILAEHAVCIGFSVYCWNSEDTIGLARQIRQEQPQTFILCGGPDITMKDETETLQFFENKPFVDLLVFGEAETKITRLLQAGLSGETPALKVTGYAFHPRHGGAADFSIEYIDRPDNVPEIYPYDVEIKRSESCGLAMVYETGRGCPYRCIYCQFSHRNHTPFRLSIERVKKELSWLLGHGIDCIHFADAVFDLDPGFAKDVLRHCIRENKSTSLFFYCSFNRLDNELAELFGTSQAQICVGIQSTNTNVLKKINRGLSPRLFHEIKDLLARYNLNFYVDLIFGLPLDTPESFRRSFNDVQSIDPRFIMVFPLTLVKGTPLEQQARDYGVRSYDEAAIKACNLMCDIEYRNIALYEAFTLNNLEVFDDLSLAVFYFYSRFRLSLDYLSRRYSNGPALLYQSIGRKIKVFLKKTGQKATNTNFISGFEDEIKSIFISEAQAAGAQRKEITAFEDLFKLDIFRILILNAPQREKLFRQETALAAFRVPESATQLNDDNRIQRIAHGKSVMCNYRFDDLKQLYKLGESITEAAEGVFVCAPFRQWDVQVFSLSPLHRFLLDIIPSDRPIRFGHILHAAKRNSHCNAASKNEIETALFALKHSGIIGIFR